MYFWIGDGNGEWLWENAPAFGRCNRWCRPPDLSFRGAKRRGNLGEALPFGTSHRQNGNRPRLVHCEEGASPTRQSQVGTCEFAGGFPISRTGTARLPRLLRSLAMTSLGAFSHSEGHNDKLGSASLPCHCEEGASPTWQSQVGTIEFAGAFLCSGHVLRDCRGSCGASQ